MRTSAESLMPAASISGVAIALVLTSQAGLLAWSAARASPTIDETAHLPAGISYCKFGRFDLYPVNPPLVKLIAALPVLAAEPAADWRRISDSPGARPEWSLGRDFLAANGPKSLRWFTWARWACIPLVLLGGVICCRWASDLYGRVSGLLALALWSFCPLVLGFGALITPDVAAASLGAAACYAFWCWLRDPRPARAVLSGAVLGLALLTKFTWLVLFALWPALWIGAGRNGDASQPVRPAWHLGAMFLVALFVVNCGYGFEGTGTRLEDYTFVSRSLGGRERGMPWESTEGNRFRDTWLRRFPVPLPRNFVAGVDLQKRDFESPDWWNYLGGEHRVGEGWWYYYLYGFAVKLPLGTLALLLLALCDRHSVRLSLRDSLSLLGVPCAVLVLVSSQTAINQHLRYALPVLPFAFIAISRVASHWTSRSLAWRSGVTLCLGATVWSSLAVYPHSLAYFNELAGGPENGHRHLLGSNLDWGQDLYSLRHWLDEHPHARPLRLAYAGNVDPRLAEIEFTLPPDEPEPGWHAVSISLVCGMQTYVNRPDGRRELVEPGRYTWFSEVEPIERAGFSILIYDVTPETAEKLRAKTREAPQEKE